MQPNEPNPLITHYEQGGILDRIKDGLSALGKTQTTVTAEDLSPVDEFHIGGRQATGEFLDQLRLGANDHVLDIGCGIGGAARFAASRYGSTVTGVDLTGEYIETGNILCSGLAFQTRSHFCMKAQWTCLLKMAVSTQLICCMWV